MCLNLGVVLVFVVIVGLVLYDFKLLLVFIVVYGVVFLIKWIEKKVLEGLDLIVVILFVLVIVFGFVLIIIFGVLVILK